jgi:pimeloyl-ACP methyl ester carboxylesterase
VKPTIVLVHGAYADSSSWNGIIDPLLSDGHRVIAWSVPLRGVASDAAALTDLVRSVEGPVLLVGHSYGGALLTNVSADASDIVALVFVAGYALEPGESCADASGLTPGGTLGPTLERVPLSNGSVDTYIAQDKYHHQFCADLPQEHARLMAVTQRPIAESALGEPSGDQPLWKSLPSSFLCGELDRNIPAGAQRIMADRACAKRSLEIAGPRTWSACRTPTRRSNGPRGRRRPHANGDLSHGDADHYRPRSSQSTRPTCCATRARRTRAHLRAAGVDVTTVRYDGTIHDFMMLNPLADTNATRAAIAQASAVLRDALGTA